MKKITPKQNRFCQEYIIDSNATQAALRAGYAGSSVRWCGCTNLTKPNVRQEIARLRADIAVITGYMVEECQREYEEARQLAIRTNQPAAAATATTGKARLYGFDKDNSLNSEKTVIIIAPKHPKRVESEVIGHDGV